jgi:hypothetical protein
MIFRFSNAVQAFYFANLVDSDEYNLVSPAVAVEVRGTRGLDLLCHIATAIRENVK